MAAVGILVRDCLTLARRPDRLGAFEHVLARGDRWVVERNGTAVAELTHARFADEFWVRYTVSPIVGHEAELPSPTSSAFWEDCRHVRLRSVHFQAYAEGWY